MGSKSSSEVINSMLLNHINIFFNGSSRKFGMSLFHMSAHNGLMFWGGEFEQEIHLLKSRRGAQFDVPGLGDASNNGEPRAVLRVKVEGGVPRQSKYEFA